MTKCAVFVKNPVESDRKWGEEKLPIAHQYAYLGGEISRNFCWDAHVNQQIEKGKAQRGEMDVIIGDYHLDTRIEICILMNVIVP